MTGQLGNEDQSEANNRLDHTADSRADASASVWSGVTLCKEEMNAKIKVFDYDPVRDVLTITPTYSAMAEDLGLSEWNPVVWIGRLFTMDNDLGEHWFDNWDLRESRGPGFEDAFIIDPEKLQDGKDGPCHSPEFRKRFWTDVLSSFELSLDILFDQARLFQEEIQTALDESPSDGDFRAERILDLEERIERIRKQHEGTTSGPTVRATARP